MKFLLALLVLLILAYVGICAWLYFKQDGLLFFPRHAPAAELESDARQMGFEPWENERGERIGWKSLDRDFPAAGVPKNALLICHGNGGFALGRNYANLRPSAAAQAAGVPNFQIFLLEYPGYGAREGKPSARSLTDAAIDALDTLHANPERRLWLMGQSLGTGIACAAVVARPGVVSGLVLITPFDSLAAAAGTHYPWLPVRLLLNHRLDSDQNLESFHRPVAFVVAGDDTTIPPRHGQRLYAGYAGPKRLWLVPKAGHNDFDELLADWPQISAWLVGPH